MRLASESLAKEWQSRAECFTFKGKYVLLKLAARTMKTQLLPALAILFVAAALHAAEPRPNVIVILADDKYDCPTRNVEICRESVCLFGKLSDPRMSLNCGCFSAIARN